jgi:hypothetical protein
MMAQLRIDFQGRGKVQTFSLACVQAMGDGIPLALRVARQVREKTTGSSELKGVKS